jgi:DNA-binding NarL/FixJ family response regulator
MYSYPILFLSMHKSEEFLSMALAAGARGYLLKEDSGEELLTAIAHGYIDDLQ